MEVRLRLRLFKSTVDDNLMITEMKAFLYSAKKEKTPVNVTGFFNPGYIIFKSL